MKKFFTWLMLATMITSAGMPTTVSTNPERPLWMRYPVISPDGKTIVFSYKGDLYKVSADGGIATPITLSDAYDFMPVFSPDGKSIVYASNQYGNFDLFTVSLDGGKSKRLTYHSSSDLPQYISADGKTVYFTSSRMDSPKMIQFPYGALSEVYSVPLAGGREKMELSIPAIDLKWNKNQTKMIFHDLKGYEDPMRKHHTSAVARDLWLFQKADSSFTKLTDFAGEDRNPVWNHDENTIFYLSEKSGSFNVWSMPESDTKNQQQLTHFEKNPVRFLSISDNNTLCFGYDGEIYTLQPGNEPKRVQITIQTDERYPETETKIMTSEASDMAVSPSGKEIAFIVRGEVFVTGTDGGETRRITNTPEQERNVSFSPDGRSILYAAERNKIWGIYQTKLARKEDNYFFMSSLYEEEALVVNDKESFQPKYSPDGKEIAYLENRTGVNVYNLETKKIRTILPARRNYSYADGDQSFNWSPDSKFILVNFLQDGNWHEQIGLADASGKDTNLLELTQSGFSNGGAQFMMDGKMMLWFSNRDGMRNVASHGSQQDAYGLFFTREAFDLFKMKKPEYELWKEKEKEKEKKKKEEDQKKAETEKKTKKTAAKDEVPAAEPLKIEKDGLLDRKARLTLHSSELWDAFMSPDGEQLYYFTRFDDGLDLWVRKFKEEETKILIHLNAKSVHSATMDKAGKNIYCVADGQLTKLDLEKGERKNMAFKAEMELNKYAERAYMFEHIWRQVKEKFYVTNLHHVDWNYYKETYAKFLPYINNNRDFAEMCSEMLGELNASHTGCFTYDFHENADQTANLGAFFDENYTGKGLKITEILEKGPLVNAGTKIKNGVIIEKIDGNEILPDADYYHFLNRKAGDNVLLALYDPQTKERWEEVIKPIGAYATRELLYDRWVKRLQQKTDELSGGQLGYMHVRGMDDESYREFYDQVMGKYINKKALIVDTRFNGGGWLHDDLATFLSGKQYISFVPREQKIGVEPASKWIKPSAVLMSEGNYSDAHMFPMVYKTLGIGPLIGMPVPGTGTAVWWEQLQDETLVFGIPQVGVMTMDGKYYENNQCEPDYKVENDYKSMLNGEDKQLEKAVEVLLQGK